MSTSLLLPRSSDHAFRYVIKKDVEGEKKVLRSIQSILNKLTPEKFSVLVEKLINIILDSVEYLDGIVDLIFNKAVMEFNFSSMYADLCQVMSHLFVPGSAYSRFRRSRLCQHHWPRSSRVRLSGRRFL
jgi:hypothetical protein